MTILGIPLAILLGILTITSLFTTASFGFVYHYLHKPVFRYHRFFAIFTIFLAIIHAILVINFLQAPSNSEPKQEGQELIIEIKDFAFNPQDITVKKGDKITWINRDSVIHTATSYDNVFDSGNLSEGKSFSYVFSEAGNFEYFCKPHPYMKGKIVVE